MKQNFSILDFAVTAFIAGALLALLDAWVVARHGSPLGWAMRTSMSVSFASLFAFVRAQARSTLKVQTAPEPARAAALTFAPEPALAVLYLLRDSRFAHRAGFDVEVGGTLRAQTRGRTFVRLLLEPGRHRVASRHPLSGARTEYTLDCGAGQVIYLQQDLGWGWSQPRQELRLLEAALAQPRIAACRMLQPIAAAEPRAA